MSGNQNPRDRQTLKQLWWVHAEIRRGLAYQHEAGMRRDTPREGGQGPLLRGVLGGKARQLNGEVAVAEVVRVPTEYKARSQGVEQLKHW